MYEWPMQVRDDDGSLSRVLIEARTKGDAMSIANRKGYVVEWCADSPNLPDPEVHEGKAMGKVAELMAALSLILFPLCIPALICGAVASDKSKGAHGGGAMKLATFVLILWVIILAVVLLA